MLQRQCSLIARSIASCAHSMPSEQSFAVCRLLAAIMHRFTHLVRKMVLEDHDRIVAPRRLHLVALLVVRPLGVAGDPRVPVHRERDVALVPEPLGGVT